MGEKLELSPEKPVIKFEDLRLSDVSFEESPEQKDGENYYRVDTKVDFEFDGVPYNLLVDKNERNGDSADVAFSFLVRSGHDHLLFSSLGFTPISPDSGIVTSNIGRKGGKKGAELLPRKFGVSFYGKMLDLIQDQANQKQKNFLHVIVHEKNMGMDDEQWHKVFARLLSDRGYEMIEDGGDEKFRKMYVPEKTS